MSLKNSTMGDSEYKIKNFIHENYIRITFIHSRFMQNIHVFFFIRTLLSIYESISVTTFQSEVCISLLRLSASVRMKNYFPKNGISRKVVTAAFSMLFCVISFDFPKCRCLVIYSGSRKSYI